MDELLKKLDYFRQERDWEKFHSLRNLAIALNLEAAELLEKFQWNDEGVLTKKEEEELKDELADVFIDLMLFSLEMDVDLLELAEKKLKKLDERYPASKVKGISKRDMLQRGVITKDYSTK